MSFTKLIHLCSPSFNIENVSKTTVNFLRRIKLSCAGKAKLDVETILGCRLRLCQVMITLHWFWVWTFLYLVLENWVIHASTKLKKLKSALSSSISTRNRSIHCCFDIKMWFVSVQRRENLWIFMLLKDWGRNF